MTHKIRTTLNPGEVLTVDDAEYTDLERMGVLLSDEAVAKLDEREAAEAAKLAEADGAPAKAPAKKEK